MKSFPVLDTHTGGEITRIVSAAEIGLDADSPARQLVRLRGELDWVRIALTSEPRGSAYAVGAIVTSPVAPEDDWGIVFFNNVGYLGMCGHGLFGVIEALRYQGLINTGTTQFITPAGPVTASLFPNHSAQFNGVTSYCYRRDVTVDCDDGSRVRGDIAYGGNWFFLTADPGVGQTSLGQLTARTQMIRDSLDRSGIGGADGAVIDHVELYCPLHPTDNDLSPADELPQGSRNFVLCPGGHYDRSPCGTGTSAKLACLAARGELAPGEKWIQQSVTGSQFIASYQPVAGGVRVTIRGRAHVIAETMQYFDPTDPLRHGFTEST
ncbi:proline racemase family protein [Stieleria sp. TO1_6]|uniref:proline racemase family protein n=1 Tax=Stieleria tagensis TaxID=2956795 RepID=UPI00209B9A60|nr:proline racemase family protein [Stieleria tagensis]MCO8124486.1 proline racemase family protein [Stieleria tagensis]